MMNSSLCHIVLLFPGLKEVFKDCHVTLKVIDLKGVPREATAPCGPCDGWGG